MDSIHIPPDFQGRIPGISAYARFFIVLGALNAAVSVVLGAAGSHVLSGRLAGTLAWFQTALQYHQFHALGLLLVGIVVTFQPTRWIIAAGWLMIAGTLLFSGNLYLRSLTGFTGLHALTPVGGAAFILAWLALAAGILTARKHRPAQTG